jgi:hypothetical protein
MTSQHDLLAYLQEQADEGVVDSAGDFTVSLQNARKKLAKFALPRETAWVSKLVQAAAAWKMKTMLVGQSKDETQFFFQTSTPAQLPTPNEVVNALLSGKIALETPLDHFCLGLRALVEQATLSFLLVVNDGEVKPQPIYAGAHYGKLSEGARLGEKFDRAVGMTLTVRHSPPITGNSHMSEVLGLKQFGLPILEELRDYAYPSPVPIVQSGRHLEGFLDSPLFRQSSQRPLVLSGLTNLAHSPERLPLPPSFEEKQLSFLTHPRRARRNYQGQKSFACAYILKAGSPTLVLGDSYRRGNFNWVRDGVVVQSSSLDIRTKTMGLHIMANAEGLKTDLTGFQLVQDEVYFNRKAEIFTALGDQILTWYDRVDDFFREDRDEESAQDEEFDADQAFRKRVKVLLKGSAAGLLLTLVNPPFGVTATLGSMATAYGPHFWKRENDALAWRETQTEALKGDLLLLSQELKRLAEQLGESVEPLTDPIEIDPTDEAQIADLFKQYEKDPEGLTKELKNQASTHRTQPLWFLHLARAYKREGNQRAALFFNRYLDKRQEPEVFEELATFYEDSGKETLARMVRMRKDNPGSNS